MNRNDKRINWIASSKASLVISWLLLVINVGNLNWTYLYYCDEIKQPESLILLHPYLLIGLIGFHFLFWLIALFRFPNSLWMTAQHFILLVSFIVVLLMDFYFVFFLCGYMW